VNHGGVSLHWLAHHQLSKQGSLATVTRTTDQNIYEENKIIYNDKTYKYYKPLPRLFLLVQMNKRIKVRKPTNRAITIPMVFVSLDKIWSFISSNMLPCWPDSACSEADIILKYNK
jgi:hypothetical protein